MDRSSDTDVEKRLVHVAAGPVKLEGNLSLPTGARGIVLFAHGTGSSRHSSRNQYVARPLNEAKLATLLIDLLTGDEEVVDLQAGHLRFDIGLLARRLIGTTDWLTQYIDTRGLRIGYFGASTGAAAALVSGSRARRRRGRSGFARRPARSGRAGPEDCPGAHAAHRRGERCRGHRAEPRGSGAAPLRKAACDRRGSDAPFRGTGGAGRGGADRPGLVRTLSRRCRAGSDVGDPIAYVTSRRCRSPQGPAGRGVMHAGAGPANTPSRRLGPFGRSFPSLHDEAPVTPSGGPNERAALHADAVSDPLNRID